MQKMLLLCLFQGLGNCVVQAFSILSDNGRVPEDYNAQCQLKHKAATGLAHSLHS